MTKYVCHFVSGKPVFCIKNGHAELSKCLSFRSYGLSGSEAGVALPCTWLQWIIHGSTTQIAKKVTNIKRPAQNSMSLI